jgi:D-alanyl-lipoteichoic acid acyltransferase DltB (MBOAT superfamily)
MLFNSLEFAVFVPLVFIIYWMIKPQQVKLQNAFVLGISYIFYGWWDWRFLILILISSAVDFFVGLALDKTLAVPRRKVLLGISLVVNLGLLGFFKYFNFFTANFAEAFTLLGKPIDPITLDIILPIGISFYTFQTLSYTIDIYKKRFKATDDIIAFFAFVSFFPQLVAGPIERAKDFLPQFMRQRVFELDKAKDGLRQILWGLVNKVVIADSCAKYVDPIFADHANYAGSTLWLAGVLFAFQIYCDFAGYSHIAIGTARLLGFNLTQNFRYPFFARDFADLWTRWHISLTTWFRDYLYFPIRRTWLGRRIKEKTVFISFALIGFWHGPSWGYVVWGLMHASYLLIFKTWQVSRKQLNKALIPTRLELVQMAYVFFLGIIAILFFRVPHLGDVIEIYGEVFSPSFLSFPSPFPFRELVLCTGFLIAEWLNRFKPHTLDFSDIHMPWVLRWMIYYLLVILVIWWGVMNEKEAFIYFQF